MELLFREFNTMEVDPEVLNPEAVILCLSKVYGVNANVHFWQEGGSNYISCRLCAWYTGMDSFICIFKFSTDILKYDFVIAMKSAFEIWRDRYQKAIQTEGKPRVDKGRESFTAGMPGPILYGELSK